MWAGHTAPFLSGKKTMGMKKAPPGGLAELDGLTR